MFWYQMLVVHDIQNIVFYDLFQKSDIKNHARDRIHLVDDKMDSYLTANGDRDYASAWLGIPV